MSDQPVQLHIHPSCARGGVEALAFRFAHEGEALRLRYDLIADLSRLNIPEAPGGRRRDGLWQHTCFEAFFAAPDETGYTEFNFAPNGDWAAYRFAGYRKDGRDLETPAPRIESSNTETGLSISVTLDALPRSLADGPIRIGPSAVIEARDGVKSYWALHHPANKPDFHRIENFKLSLD